MLYGKTATENWILYEKVGNWVSRIFIVFVCTEMNLIVFSDPSKCVNTQYSALSGALYKPLSTSIPYNYNCHNIYWDPLICLVKNSFDCIDLYFIFQWTSVRIHEGPGLLFWYCAMLLWRQMDSRQLLSTYTLLYTYTDIFRWKVKINLHMTLKLTIVMPISYDAISPPFCFFNVVTSHTRHSASHR